MQIKSWVNSRVLITGASGFVGRALCEYLKNKKAKVFGITRKDVDLVAKKRVDTVLATYKPDICYHLASEALVETGQHDPYKTFYNNIVSTLNVLEACRNQNVTRIIVASTAHVYGASQDSFDEEDPARPSRPYETSKTCADLIAQSYADQYNFSVLIPRFVNIYGPGDMNMTRIIPKTIRSILQHKKPTLWGGKATRDYLYIDDVLRAYDRLGKISDSKIEQNRIFNFATGESISAENLIKKIIALSDKKISIQKISDIRTHELAHQDVNWSKAKRILDWYPTVDLTEGLTHTLKWFNDMVISTV